MNQLAAICDSPENARRVHWQLKGLFDIQCLSPDELGAAQPPGRYTIVAVNLDDLERVRGIRHWLTQKPKDAKVIFVTDQGSRLDRVRARAVGATDFVQPPVNASALLTKLYGDFQCVRGKPKFCDEASPGIVAALESVQAAFALAWLGAPFDQTAMNGAAEAITDQVEEQGLASWIETVRRHRSHTYRHSLLVTGLAVGFGLQLGFSRTDTMRLSFAGIMHDIGKAKIPASILEKPGALDADEMDVIKQHPMFGWQALRNVSGIPAEIMDAVLHHHEFLDGTGYPHGLAGRAISDFVRLLTIVDIFAALIEGRCYKSASSCDAAYQVLLDMGARTRLASGRGISRRLAVAGGPPIAQSRPARRLHPDPGGYFFCSVSRCLISFSSSSVCCAMRSALRSSSSAPENAAACSINCRILSRAIAMRRSSSASEREGPSFMVDSSKSWLATIAGRRPKRYRRGAAAGRGPDADPRWQTLRKQRAIRAR